MIEEVTPENDDPHTQKHYMPWHSVIREGHPTTPIRNVMNASQKDSNGLTLNSCQETGPNLIPDLLGLALRFRNNPVAFIADVSKMFLNIKIEKPQRDLHRFIAFGKTLRQTALMFGEASSPYLALETVQVHSKMFEQKFKKAAAVVQKDLYMDDTISGDQDDANVIATIHEIVEFFRLMHLKVHKINSNSTQVLQALEPELLENQEVTMVLGIQWDTINDTLVPQLPQHKPL